MISFQHIYTINVHAVMVCIAMLFLCAIACSKTLGQHSGLDCSLVLSLF